MGGGERKMSIGWNRRGPGGALGSMVGGAEVKGCTTQVWVGLDRGRMGWGTKSLRPLSCTRATDLADRAEAEAVAVGLDHQPVHRAGLWGTRRWQKSDSTLIRHKQ